MNVQTDEPIVFRSGPAARAAQRELLRVAKTQGGYFTARQAEQAGFARCVHGQWVRQGHWQREYPGIFRLRRQPLPERPDLITWALWSHDERTNRPLGVYSHQTALSVYGLSDLMPRTLHMTVPPGFRRPRPAPGFPVLRFAELGAEDVREQAEGYRLTSPLRTLVDLGRELVVEEYILSQAVAQALAGGLVTPAELEQVRPELPEFLFRGRRWPQPLASSAPAA